MKHSLRYALVACCLWLCTSLMAQSTLHLGYCSDQISADNETVMLSDLYDVRFRAAIIIPAARLKALVGAKVTKIRVGAPAGMKNWYVTLRTDLAAPAVTKSVDLPLTVEGWNEATLVEPYAITGETDLVVYYAGTLPAGQGLVLGDRTNPNGFFINYDNEWENVASYGYNALCLQAVVEADADVPGNDLAVEGVTFDKPFTQIGGEAKAQVRIANYGTAATAVPTLHYAVDGGETHQVSVTGEMGVNDFKDVTVNVPTEGCAEGYNEVRFWIEHEDAVAENNTLEAIVGCYKDAYKRRVLVEHFTTLACVNCPYGDATLSAVVANRDDYVWVAHHIGYMEDELTNPRSYDIGAIVGVNAAPMAAFDRTMLPFSDNKTTPAGSIGYSSAAAGKAAIGPSFDYCANTPAFVSVNISANYDAATRTLSATVQGERNAMLNLLYPEANLTVLLAEDNVHTEGRQTGSGSQIHNHVFRQFLTSSHGDAIDWQDNAYSYTCTTDIPDTWNVENLRVVAFVNRPYQNNDCTQLQVLNANDLRLQTVSAVHGIEAAEAPVQRTCYNLQGQRISEPTKGIYIEKVVTPSGIRCLKRVR